MAEYRVRFSKGKEVKFLSHLDLVKTFERAIRRADLPLAYSEGFHPHPKLSFGPALAVGISSLEEYVDLETTVEFASEELMDRLNRKLPNGLQVQAVKQCRTHPKPLNAVINRASYLLVLEVNPSERTAIVAEIDELMSKETLDVTRVNKNGQKVVNIRPWLHNLKTEAPHGEELHVDMTGEIGSGGNLRPEDILQLLTYPVRTRNIVRIGLWHAENDLAVKPLDLC